MLKPCQLPVLHETIKKEFARRYRFDYLIQIKERDLGLLISNENSKRHNFISQYGKILPKNPLTDIFLDYEIELNIKRNKRTPKVNDVETEDTAFIEEEIRKEAKEKERTSKLNEEIKLLKAELKLKNEEMLRIQADKASDIER